MPVSIAHFTRSILGPLAVLIALSVVTIGLAMRVYAPDLLKGRAKVRFPETVIISAGSYSFRPAGDYYFGNQEVDAPELAVVVNTPLEIMKYQVTAANYAACVMAHVCAPAEPAGQVATDKPVVGVSFADAQSYARYFSALSGENWSLPSDAEWARAAGASFPDDALHVDPKSTNPADRWLADYEREAMRTRKSNPVVGVLGSFGENEQHVADMLGNVWEWTSTCYQTVHLDQTASTKTIGDCGVYVVEGTHRAPMSSFIRDPKGGACSVGRPPDNLGFRLVRR